MNVSVQEKGKGVSSIRKKVYHFNLLICWVPYEKEEPDILNEEVK